MSSSDQDQMLKLIETKDGSQTILNAELGSTYHSRHGALTESKHVFIDQGLRKFVDGQISEITVLEMGFGTGLNALLTFGDTRKRSLSVKYHGLELNPVPESVWRNYQLPMELANLNTEFESMHSAAWNLAIKMGSHFELIKHNVSLLEFESELSFDLVYFDAFEPETQPELWTEEVFSKLFDMMSPGGILTTYCCKGYVRRNMIAAGFVVEKVPGPPGKREMIVAQRAL